MIISNNDRYSMSTTYITLGLPGNKSKLVNINGSNDPFYRYKMHQMLIQVIGSGKMIKTHILNIDEVTKDLNIKPGIILTFFKNEFNTTYDYKIDKKLCYIVGNYDIEEWNNKFKKFLEVFIICQKCSIPELDLDFYKLEGQCRGCGKINQIKINDKLTKNLLKLQ